MNRVLYSVLLYLSVPIILLRLLVRSSKSPSYRRRWKERFAFGNLAGQIPPGKQSIWIHSVSVGETLAAVPLIRALRERWPDMPVVVTTMTPTGSDRVKQVLGDTVLHCYMPYDLPGAIGRFLTAVNPRVLIIMETELWPNTIHQCHRLDVKMVLANARLSGKSARGYARISGMTQSMLQKIDLIAAQSADDARRLVELGAREDRVKVFGSIKNDIEVPHISLLQLPAIFQEIASSTRPVVIAASTREGEEEQVLKSFKQCLQSRPGLLLILVPRHPERFDAVALLCQQNGLLLARRSSASTPGNYQVLLGDSMGEMWWYYNLAQVAFVGGSLVDTGCHNVLEPAALAIPVLVGPSQFNFASICEQLELAGALKTVRSPEELADAIIQLLEDDQLRDSMGVAGQQYLQANRGSVEKLLNEIQHFME
jgi:3-deoxy-D-manno-octulosonic-acid transferase